MPFSDTTPRTELPPKGLPTQRILEAREAMESTGLLEQPPLKAEGTSLRVEGPDVQLIDSHRELLAVAEAMLAFLPSGDYPTAGANTFAVKLRDEVRQAINTGRFFHR